MDIENKKIAIINFPINDVGGINTYGEALFNGFERNLQTVHFYHLTPSKNYGCDPKEKIVKTRYSIIPGNHLSYNAENLKRTLEILNAYDVLIFLHASPHPTKENLGKKDIENWKLLYKNTTPKKVVIFHDAMWERTNKWFEDVANDFDLLVSAQKKFHDSALAYPGQMEKYWDYFPFDIQKTKVDAKTDLKNPFGIVATQWLGWKNHEKFLPMLPQVQIPIKFYSNGIEYCNLRANGILGQYINKDYSKGEVYDNESIHNFYGFILHEKLVEQYAKSLFSIDLSTRGYVNYTHCEPLLFKSISFMERRVFEDKDNTIPEEFLQIYDLLYLPDVINEYKIPTKQIEAVKKAKKAYEWATEKYDNRRVCNTILTKLFN
jgi:hypothetical protein